MGFPNMRLNRERSHLSAAYLEEIQSVRRHTNSSDPKNTNLPVLVHCSAGVGRTGVVILSEVMIACLEHNEVTYRNEGGMKKIKSVPSFTAISVF